jgi:hypothetical protein
MNARIESRRISTELLLAGFDIAAKLWFRVCADVVLRVPQASVGLGRVDDGLSSHD